MSSILKPYLFKKISIKLESVVELGQLANNYRIGCRLNVEYVLMFSKQPSPFLVDNCATRFLPYRDFPASFIFFPEIFKEIKFGRDTMITVHFKGIHSSKIFFWFEFLCFY